METNFTYRSLLIQLGYKYNGYLKFGDQPANIPDHTSINLIERDINHYCCKDCGIYTWTDHDAYMVKNYIWDIYGVGDGMLCMECLQKRMGFFLRANHFISCELNRENANIGVMQIKDHLANMVI